MKHEGFLKLKENEWETLTITINVMAIINFMVINSPTRTFFLLLSSTTTPLVFNLLVALKINIIRITTSSLGDGNRGDDILLGDGKGHSYRKTRIRNKKIRTQIYVEKLYMAKNTKREEENSLCKKIVQKEMLRY